MPAVVQPRCQAPLLLRHRLLYSIASLLLVLSGAWNLRGALLEKAGSADPGSLKAVITYAGGASCDLHTASSQRRGLQLTERRKERSGSWQGSLSLVVQTAVPTVPLLFTEAFAAWKNFQPAGFNKYKLLITFLQTVI